MGFVEYITTPADISTKHRTEMDEKTKSKADSLLSRRWQKIAKQDF